MFQIFVYNVQVLPNLNFNDEMSQDVFCQWNKKSKDFHAFARGFPGEKFK